MTGVSFCVAAVLALAPLGQVKAAEPAVVVSFSGYDALIGDIGYVGGLINQPGAAQQLEGLLTLFTQGKGLQGLDKTRPWGVVASVDAPKNTGGDPNVEGMAFIPVSDIAGLMKILEPLVGKTTDKGNGRWQIDTQAGQPVYVLVADGWAFVAPNEAMLVNVPSDPMSVLGGLSSKYDLAVQIDFAKVPPELRQVIVDQIRQGAQMSMQQAEGEDDATFQARKAMTEAQLGAMTQSFDEMDKLMVGLSVDKGTRRTFIDIKQTVKDGSQSAADLALQKGVTSRFSGFLQPSAVATGQMTAVLSKASIEQALQAMSEGMNQARAEMAKNPDLANDPRASKIANRVFDDLTSIIRSTVESGKLDGAMAVVGDGPVSFVAGMHLEDTAKLDSLVRYLFAELQNELKNDPNAAAQVSLKLDAETYNGVTFHTIAGPVPDANAQLLLGSQLTVAIGISGDAAYIAAGPNGMAELKSAMERSASGGAANPGYLSISLKQALSLAQKVNPQEPAIGRALAAVAGDGGDKIVISSEVADNATTLHIDIAEGVLKLIGVAAQEGQNARGGNASPF